MPNQKIFKNWPSDIFTADFKIQTLHAWEPWRFSQMLLFSIQTAEIEEEFPEWRIYWFSGVAVLRTIGHVLHKIDASKSQKHKDAIENVWKEWKAKKDEHWIYFDFIEKERNNILKEFSFGAELPSAEDDRTLAYGNTEYNAAQLFREAVYWWRHQLTEIENVLKT